MSLSNHVQQKDFCIQKGLTPDFSDVGPHNQLSLDRNGTGAGVDPP